MTRPILMCASCGVSVGVLVGASSRPKPLGSLMAFATAAFSSLFYIFSSFRFAMLFLFFIIIARRGFIRRPTILLKWRLGPGFCNKIIIVLLSPLSPCIHVGLCVRRRYNKPCQRFSALPPTASVCVCVRQMRSLHVAVYAAPRLV